MIGRQFPEEGPRFSRAQIRSARIATTAVFGFHGVALAQWFLRIPDVKIQAGLDDGQLGLALLGGAMGSVPAMPIAGALTARFGSTRVTAGIAVTFMLLFGLPSFATSQWILFGALMLFGVAVGGIDVAFNSQASDVEEHHGAPLMSGFHGSWSLFSLVGTLIAAPVMAMGISPEMHLTVTGLLAGGAIFVTTRWFLPSAPRHAETTRSVARLTPALLALGAIAGLSLLVEGAVADWSGIYLRTTLEMTPASAGLAFGAFSVTMATARLLGDRVAARFDPRTVLASGAVLSGLGVLTAVAIPNPVLAVGGFALCGVGIGTIFPIALSAASRLPGQTPGAAIAAVATMGYAGFLAGPPLIGGVSRAFSLAVGFGVAIVASAVMFLLTRLIPTARTAVVEVAPVGVEASTASN
ncbi:MAG: hypothetical protein RL022_1645 [Chloroflexota bacterium]|jgi:MFS family permease